MLARVHDMSAEKVAPSASVQAAAVLRQPWPGRLDVMLLVVDMLLFLGGMVTHSGLAIPLGVATWTEPNVFPAAVVEGLGAIGLAVTVAGIAAGIGAAHRLAWWVLWYCFAGVLWGMARLAMGSIPEARTMSNDFLHIAMTVMTTTGLVRLASRWDGSPAHMASGHARNGASAPRRPGGPAVESTY